MSHNCYTRPVKPDPQRDREYELRRLVGMVGLFVAAKICKDDPAIFRLNLRLSERARTPGEMTFL